MKPTYRVSTYDVADNLNVDGEWTVRAIGLPLWKVRHVIRYYWGESYDNCSILVERERGAAVVLPEPSGALP